MKEFQLLVIREILEFIVGKVFENTGDLGHIVMNQMLGADPRIRIQARIADVGQVPVQTLTQMMHQLAHVASATHLTKMLETAAYQAPVVILRGLVFLPIVATLAPVELSRSVAPGAVVQRMTHGLLAFPRNPIHAASPKYLNERYVDAWAVTPTSADAGRSTGKLVPQSDQIDTRP